MIKNNKSALLFFSPFLLVIAVLLCVRILLIASYSLDLNGIEYYFIHIIQKVIAEEPIYQNPETIPFDNCLYTPLYFYIVRFVSGIFHINFKDDIYGLFVIARILSFLFVLMQLVYLGKITRLFTKSTFQIILVITFYLLLISEHMYSARPDSLKIMFFTIWLYHFIQYFFFTGKTKNLFLLFLFGLLAILSKQDIIIHLATLFLTLNIYRKQGKVFLVSIYFALAILGIMLICYFIYGNYFLTNIFLFNFQSASNILHSYIFTIIIISLVRTLPFLFLTIMNIYSIKKNNKNSESLKYISYNIVIFYFIVHLFSMHRAGSNLNYTYELLVQMVISIPFFHNQYKEEIKQYKLLYSSILLIGILFLSISNFAFSNYTYSLKKEDKLKSEYKSYLTERQKIKNIIKNEYTCFPNTKYSVFYFDNNIIYGHDMHLDRFINYYNEYAFFKDVPIKTKLHFIDSHMYDESFTNGSIKYIITENSQKSIHHINQYYTGYKKEDTIGNMIIYKFNQ